MGEEVYFCRTKTAPSRARDISTHAEQGETPHLEGLDLLSIKKWKANYIDVLFATLRKSKTALLFLIIVKSKTNHPPVAFLVALAVVPVPPSLHDPALE